MGACRRDAKFSPSLREAGEGVGGRGPAAAGAIPACATEVLPSPAQFAGEGPGVRGSAERAL
jgi:hypothetical protein